MGYFDRLDVLPPEIRAALNRMLLELAALDDVNAKLASIDALAAVTAALVDLASKQAALDTLVAGTLSYSDTSATPGSATANVASGRAAIAASASACVITNNKVLANSVVLVQLEDADTTAIRIVCVPAGGSFTVTANAAATADTKFRWYVVGAI